jgi:hypothetical protein
MQDRDDRLEEGQKDTEVRRDTQVRGSLGIPPSGQRDDRGSEQRNPELDLDRMRGQSDVDDDDRMSER